MVKRNGCANVGSGLAIGKQGESRHGDEIEQLSVFPKKPAYQHGTSPQKTGKVGSNTD